MEVKLDTVQALAPDQASVNAAKKLLSKSKWPLLGQDPSVNSIWGQCQGSGSKPYLTMVDVVDHGYKCTCPSRKFPCKHVLALMWQFADAASNFAEGQPPDWVQDWLGRRKRSSDNKQEAGGDAGNTDKKKLSLDVQEEAPKLSPEEQEKRDSANAKRAAQLKAKTEASVTAGLEELQQWIGDQLRTGIGGFLKEVNERCRRIASRLVDAKASTLASRLDELPARILGLGLGAEQQARHAFRELGQLVLLSEAWKANPQDPDVRRAILTAEKRDEVIQSETGLKVEGLWEIIGEKILTRRDGLISHASWALQLDAEDARLALLLDYYPATSGARPGSLNVGSQLSAQMHFYPGRQPLRAVMTDQQMLSEPQLKTWQHQGEFWQKYSRFIAELPWVEACPHVFPEGKIFHDPAGAYWWQNPDGSCLPLLNRDIPKILTGADIKAALMLWDGDSAEIFSAQTETWGAIAC